MNAEEASKAVPEVLKKKQLGRDKLMDSNIEWAISEGRYEVVIEGDISDEKTAELESRGFEVEFWMCWTTVSWWPKPQLVYKPRPWWHKLFCKDGTWDGYK